jgi:hypothetical protein
MINLYTGRVVNICAGKTPFLSTLNICWNENNIIFKKVYKYCFHNSTDINTTVGNDNATVSFLESKELNELAIAI